MTDFDFLTDQADLIRTQWRASPSVAAKPDGIVVELERFALTANNLTYAKLGSAFRYWDYFPAPAGWGRTPVWGVARVVESSTRDIIEGERVYGFLPISTRCELTPAPHGASGFVDAAPHRADLPPTYNEYRLIDRDPGYDRDDEDAFLALRPLFSLGFFLAEWLAEQAYFGTERVIVSSASSKTAAALAHQLKGRVRTLGLTSERNLAAIANMGLFDEAVAYSAVADSTILTERSAVLADIAGDPELAARLKERMGAALVRTIRVGATHSDPAQSRTPVDLNGTQFFFAPAHILRLREQCGAAQLRERLAESSQRFMRAVRDRLRFENLSGRAAIAGAYDRVARGAAPGEVVPILSALDLA
jgi:hypothetical protein